MSKDRLDGRIALVMGGGSSNAVGGPSNGQAASLTYARHGAIVVVVDRHAAAAEATAHDIVAEGGRAVAGVADVADGDTIRDLVERVARDHGRIDVLHNNVGIEAPGDVVDTTEDDWDRVHDVNLKGVFLTCKHVVPVMRAQGGGAIVNISSTASLRWSSARFLAYNSSKAALNHMSRIMARQLAPDRIRVNVVVPGMMDTPHIRTLYRDLTPEQLAAKLAERDAACPMGRQGTCWDVAEASLFLAGDRASYITGVLLPVDGGLSV